MPKSSPKELATKAAYNKRPDVQAKRVEQNRARRHANAAGKAHVGDGTEVDHIKPLDKGGSDKDSNTRVVPASKNRAWRKDNGDMYGKKK